MSQDLRQHRSGHRDQRRRYFHVPPGKVCKGSLPLSNLRIWPYSYPIPLRCNVSQFLGFHVIKKIKYEKFFKK